ncbi:Ku protein [Pseudaminobacter salicylatoxidans]|uniref:non-homologous end joining protein Ku n=1 Tax=Pseudaminobacter salicylatoxidans TaxID=93369 RepID=UPI000593E401|nr:Ku protein [Pseudaminobacter salicylatoxidans]
MVAPRAMWKGFLKLGSVTCAIKLAGATSEAERVHLRILNRKTREPVKAAYMDESTGKPVEREDQIKGYEVQKNEYLLIEPEEIARLKIESEHTLEIESFVEKAQVDPVYLEKPYYVYPADKPSTDAFAVIREAMRRTKKAGLASIVLSQRERHVLVEPEGNGMLMTILHSPREIVPAQKVFGDLKDRKIDPDMTEIATMIIDKKVTRFDPSKFEDQYENALLELIKAKREGKQPPKAAPRPKENVVNLADVLKKSLEKEGIASPSSGNKQGAKRKKSA